MRILIFIFALFMPFAANAKMVVQPEDIDSITVLAPTSLAVPVTELCKIYSVKTKHDVNAVFNSESENIQSVEDGDPADIIIITGRKWLKGLESKGLIDNQSEKIIAKNKMALVASRFMDIGKTNNARNGFNNAYNKTLLVIADAEVDALGDYTREAMAKLGVWDKYSARSLPQPTSSLVADLTIKGQQAGVVFFTDALLHARDLNIVATLPQNMHKEIEYLGAVVVGEDMVKAKDFLNFLSSAEAQKLLRKYGFVVQ